jgi:hypothetical protein
MTYNPKVNDYVKWNNHEGWVYFKCDEYLTIELGTTPKLHCEYTKNKLHQKNHILLVCYRYCWDELNYVRTRKSKYEE